MTPLPTALDAPAALQALQEGRAWLIDVREPAEVARAAYDAPRVVAMPLSQFERRFHELPRDQALILACASGGRSLQAMQFLAHHGYTHLANLQGGIGLWRVHGLPVRSE